VSRAARIATALAIVAGGAGRRLRRLREQERRLERTVARRHRPRCGTRVAEVIVGVDVAKLAFRRSSSARSISCSCANPVLQQSWQEVHDGCKIDVIKQVKHVVLAIGPHAPGGRPGTGRRC